MVSMADAVGEEKHENETRNSAEKHHNSPLQKVRAARVGPAGQLEAPLQKRRPNGHHGGGPKQSHQTCDRVAYV